MQEIVSKAIIKRLPRYYRYLEELKAEGIERISSKDLSERMNVTASQIRQDLNHFGGFGQQGYGYKVDLLYEEIGKILGLNKIQHIIVIGAGHLGQALSHYTNYRNRGFYIEAIFDRDPKKIGKDVYGLSVQSMESLLDYIRSHKVDIVAITIPKQEAVKIVPSLVDAGIRAIWNFAHTELPTPKNVVVENVHLSESLMQLSYKMKEMQDKENGKDAD